MGYVNMLNISETPYTTNFYMNNGNVSNLLNSSGNFVIPGSGN